MGGLILMTSDAGISEESSRTPLVLWSLQIHHEGLLKYPTIAYIGK
ncbi:hypothetical protein Pla110_24860 [Polystyrenella longa]|uniref:Uncharacterized protein n=1 Tax=Polystyrenella longa TaxID=2528007 RepID=A0A518CNG0_9PLAN|nr:hypothetical protein Pla110_24860 [Polystyrenella longa]